MHNDRGRIFLITERVCILQRMTNKFMNNNNINKQTKTKSKFMNKINEELDC